MPIGLEPSSHSRRLSFWTGSPGGAKVSDPDSPEAVKLTLEVIATGLAMSTVMVLVIWSLS